MRKSYFTVATVISLLNTTCALAAEDADAAYDFIPFLPEWVNMLLFFVGIIAVPVGVVVLFVGMYKKVFSTIWYIISLQPLRRKLKRDELAKQMEYYRDIPASGNLKVAATVMNSLSSALVADYSGLFGALILRLIDKGALKIEFKSNMYGAEPHTTLSIGQWNEVNSGQDPLKADETQLELSFYRMMREAAGGDGILQPRELRQYLRTHPKDAFIDTLRTLSNNEKSVANKRETASQLMAMRKFLLDFSLIGERDINEMALWKEYLTYATLFGIADKVSDSFSRVYPDYFKMNQMAGTRLSIVGNRSLVRYANAAVEGSRQAERQPTAKL